VLRLSANVNFGNRKHLQGLERLGHDSDVRVPLHGGTYAQASFIFAVSANVLASLWLYADEPSEHASDDVLSPLFGPCFYKPLLPRSCKSNAQKAKTTTSDRQTFLKGF